jgi:hypothetical protein
MTLDLPTRLVTDWVAIVVIVSCGLVIEAVAARHPDLPSGGGVAVAGVLALWQWARTRPVRLLDAVTFREDGRWYLRFRDGHVVQARLAPGSRVLGRSVLLRWAAGRQICTVWLMPWDLPDAELRSLTVRLRAAEAAPSAPRRQGPAGT